MSVFRSAFFLKWAELSVSLFQYHFMRAEFCVPAEETCKIMGKILGKCGRNCQEEQRICRSCLLISLRFEVCLRRRNMDIFHQFCGIMGSIFQLWAELWVTNLSQNGTSPSKAWRT